MASKSCNNNLRRLLAGALALLLGAVALRAGAPPARDQVSLNGEWPVGGTVPVYAGVAKFDQATYARDVTVPPAWTGRIVKVEFGAVNFLATVRVNGALAAEHVGGWCPFAVDVTRWAVPGKAFRLEVVVKGPRHPPITDGNGNVAWPVGGWRDRGGIADDVWLRAYGAVHIEDAFIQTSVARRTLLVDYTVHNGSVTARTVSIVAEGAGLTLSSGPVGLAAGETRTVRVSAPAEGVELYWPDRPVLHGLTSRVVEAGRVLDTETRRFGFREIEVRGNQFFWNGVRINLYGDYQTFGDTWYLNSAELHTPAAWPATVDRMKAMNLRVLRWHHNPVPAYLLDVCDEKGLLVCSESANYGRDYHKSIDHARYVENARATLAPWIRAERNHPCIYLWNATNEMTHSFTGPFDPAAMASLGAEIARLDPTRPVGYDGDTGRSNAFEFSTPGELTKNRVKDTALVDYHYPEGYNREPAGSIYGWARLVFPNQPTGSGEMLHTRSPKAELQTTMERNTWWLGVWLRGLRATDWTNVKPACWWFTDADLASADPLRRQRTLNLRNALAPVALFDRGYDDLGIAPYVTGTAPGGTWPELTAGVRARRTLMLYNDEFRDPAVTIEVELRAGARVAASGRRTIELAPGSHREIPCEFDVPAVPGGELSLVLRTIKAGVLKFEEIRGFRVVAGSRSATTAPSREIVFP